MSPKKITDTDKLEIALLYRQAGETTASLANRYGVSNSTISRILKTTIPEHEYEELIQQKRGVKVSIDDEVAVTMEPSLPIDFASPVINSEPDLAILNHSVATEASPTPLILEPSESDVEQVGTPHNSDGELESAPLDRQDLAPAVPTPAAEIASPISDDLAKHNRRVRRRSSAPEGELAQPTSAALPALSADLDDRSTIPTIEAAIFLPQSLELTAELELPSLGAIETSVPETTTVARPIQRTPVLRTARSTQHEYVTNLADADGGASEQEQRVERIAAGEIEEDEDENPEDVNVLAAMFGEEIADGDEEDFEDDDEDDDEEEASFTDRQSDRGMLAIDRLHIQVIPLSQAILPRTCYIVIDKFAELIVRPLKDFAELGQIPGEEIQQRTLPIFDNHRVAKRFSNQRTQRVIKVPDSKVFHKTSQHLKSKGITRLLVDGNIYSLN